MDFNNHVLKVISVGGKDLIWITETQRNTWIVCAALIILGIIVRIKLNNWKDVPTGFQNVIEVLVEMMENFVNDCLTEKYNYYGGYFFGIMAFLLCANLSGLIWLRPPTADLATTFGIAIVTFLMIHHMGITKAKGAYWKSYLEPVAAFLPINILGAFATPISLSFRLFGNLLGGLIIMSLVYALLPKILLVIGIPSVLHIYFDVFAGLLQSYIFCILSMTFIYEQAPE